jgi:hypothetical protein
MGSVEGLLAMSPDWCPIGVRGMRLALVRSPDGMTTHRFPSTSTQLIFEGPGAIGHSVHVIPFSWNEPLPDLNLQPIDDGTVYLSPPFVNVPAGHWFAVTCSSQSDLWMYSLFANDDDPIDVSPVEHESLPFFVCNK